jgi:hypothetical protein
MSKPDCRNDCSDPLSFPRAIFNRPGLSRLKYRIGDYVDIREALLRNLDKEANLAAWTHRGADDPGIALLEGASILGDILTFYQELYANEAYLRTAVWRESISDLVRLLGYRLSPGLGGSATFAFEVKGDKSIVVPKNFPVKAEVTGLSKPADFETSDTLIAYPWLSRFNLFRPLIWPPVKPTTVEFYIETPSGVKLKQDDRLLVGDSVAGAPGRIDNSEIVIVDSTRALHGTTLIKIKGALKRTTNATSLVAYKIGRTFRHFGHDGPQKKILPPETVISTSTTLATTIQPPPVTVQPPSMTVQPPPVTLQPPPVSVTPPPLSVQSQSEVIEVKLLDPIQKLSITPEVTITSGPTISLPSNIKMTIQPPSVMGQPPPVTVTPPPVIGQPPPVTAMPQPVTVTPPLLPIPPQEVTTTTDVPPPTEASINFIRWLNYPANPFESIWCIIEPNLATREFPLDAEVQDLPTGLPLIAQFTALINSSRTQKEQRTLVRTIASVKPIFMTWGLLSSNTSLVTLKDTLETPPLTTYLYTDIREFQFHETLSPELTLKAAPEEDPSTAGYDLLFYGTDAEAQDLKGRSVFFEMPSAKSFTASVTAVETELSPDLAETPRVRLITFDTTFTYADFPNVEPQVTAFGNLVAATQGKTEKQAALGNGDTRQVFQTFKLPKAPLTYLLSLGQTPPEVPELQIWVNNRIWKQVATFFGRTFDEQIYIVREDANNDSWVQFGDGKTGARLPSGIKNVVAKHRTGTGAFGAIKPDTKVQAGARLEKLDKIQMPGVAAGGSEPESGENARQAAPGKIQSLGRLVSLKDFENEVLGISGVTRVAASWELEDNIALLFITVLMERGREKEIDDAREVIAGFNVCRGPNRFHVRVRQGQLQYVALDVVYGLDPTYQEDQVKAEIKKVLGAITIQPAGATDTTKTNTGDSDATRGLFSVHRRRFGEREYATKIAGTVQNVAGVVWSKPTAFMSLGEAVDLSNQPIDPANIPLPLTKTLNEKVLCDGLHLLALHDVHLTASATAEPDKGVCS